MIGARPATGARPSAGTDPVVAERLGRRFGETVAVEGLDFAVGEGELFGLVGPDGAGKTTTLRMLAGVLPPTDGDAIVLGTRVAEDREAMKDSIAYMPQRFGLYTDLTVRENLDFYGDLHGVVGDERASRIERLYRFSALAPFADRLAGNLSGGMKQKLALSCALLHRPALLLLDEPTFGVDPISRRDLWLILQEMLAEGVTIVLSTSYMDEAERCDRVALLHEGRIVALDAPRALQERLAGRVFEIRAAAPREAIRLLRDDPAVARATMFGDVLHATLAEPAGSFPEDLARSLEEGASIEPVRASLEDVFIEIAGNGAGTRAAGDAGRG